MSQLPVKVTFLPPGPELPDVHFQRYQWDSGAFKNSERDFVSSRLDSELELTDNRSIKQLAYRALREIVKSLNE
jgi:hypothetical protein